MSSVIDLICVYNRIILTDKFEWAEEGENFAPRIDSNGRQLSWSSTRCFVPTLHLLRPRFLKLIRYCAKVNDCRPVFSMICGYRFACLQNVNSFVYTFLFVTNLCVGRKNVIIKCTVSN